jgi:hypothetical protein
MKRLLIACSVALGLSFAAPGCGGGGAADPAAIQAAVEKPTGTFNEAEAQKTFDDAASQEASSREASAALEGTPVAGFIGGFGGMTGQSADSVALQFSDRVKTMTLRTLQGAGDDSKDAMDGIGAAGCEPDGNPSGDQNNQKFKLKCNGLVIEYEIEGANNRQTGGKFSLKVTATFDSFVSLNKKKVTGTLKIDFSSTGGLSGKESLDSLKFTYAWDLTVDTTKIEGGMGYYLRRLWFVLKTASGYIAVVLNGYKTGNETGTIYVRDKNSGEKKAKKCEKKSASDGWVCAEVDLSAETTGDPGKGSDSTAGSGDGATAGTTGATTAG